MRSGRRKSRRHRPARAALLGDDRGVAFVVAVLSIAVLFVLVTGVSSLASGEARATPFWRDANEAFYVAESGLNHCLWKLKYEGTEIEANEGEYGVDPPTFTSESEDESQGVLPDGSSYSVWVKTDETDSTLKHVTILAVVNERSHLLKATVRQETQPFFDDDGDGTAEEDEGDETQINFPPLENLGVLHVTAGETKRIGPGSYLYDEVKIDGHGTLLLEGDTILYVRKKVKCSGNSTTNPIEEGQTEPTYDLVIYIPPLTEEDGVTKQSVTISGDAVFNGFIYAPDATCRITGNSEVYGMVVGETVKVKGATNYDESGQNIGWPASAEVNYLVESYGG